MALSSYGTNCIFIGFLFCADATALPQPLSSSIPTSSLSDSPVQSLSIPLTVPSSSTQLASSTLIIAIPPPPISTIPVRPPTFPPPNHPPPSSSSQPIISYGIPSSSIFDTNPSTHASAAMPDVATPLYPTTRIAPLQATTALVAISSSVISSLLLPQASTTLSTAANGMVLTITYYPIPTSSMILTSTNVPAITGGVIGVVFGLGVISSIGVLLYRRRRRRITAFDGNFDPARVSMASPPPEMTSMFGSSNGHGRPLSGRSTTLGHV